MNHIKHLILFTVFLLFFIIQSADIFSQTKVGYIDSKKIIETMQDARDAKQRLDNLVLQWQADLKVLQDSLKNMKNDYEKKKLILTEQLKVQTESEIAEMENTVTNFKVQKFGENGEYFEKQKEFMKPVQDRIFKAIETVAKDGKYDYVFDRNADTMLMFVNEDYDLTTKVINEIAGKQ